MPRWSRLENRVLGGTLSHRTATFKQEGETIIMLWSLFPRAIDSTHTPAPQATDTALVWADKVMATPLSMPIVEGGLLTQMGRDVNCKKPTGYYRLQDKQLVAKYEARQLSKLYAEVEESFNEIFSDTPHSAHPPHSCVRAKNNRVTKVGGSK